MEKVDVTKERRIGVPTKPKRTKTGYKDVRDLS